MSEGKRLYCKAADGEDLGIVILTKSMSEPVDLLAEDVAIKSGWRVDVTRYTGGAEYRLMGYGECFGRFDGIGGAEAIRRAGEKGTERGKGHSAARKRAA